MANDPLFWAALLACLAVLVVLIIGILGFGGGGDFNRKYANKIMRLRVAGQAFAVVLIVAFVWLRSRG